MSLELCLNAPNIPKNEDGVVFNAPWEGRAFALVVNLHKAGVFAWEDWVETFSSEIAQVEAKDGPQQSYYECWVSALQKILVASDVMSDAEFAAFEAETLTDWPHPTHVPMREPITRDTGITPASNST
ncbi:nitrile hydratase accessory protein [Epibacterium ulvae]|nr:nitrile hydratase accessory protein [Epibacterium ulvae]